MNVFLWSVAALLAALFLASGALKLLQPKEKLAAAGLAWTEDFGAETIKTIGSVEILAAVGLILPPGLGIAPVLAPFAAPAHARRGRGLGPLRPALHHRLTQARC